MNILIVGGLGYIGGRFADHLKRKYPNYSIHLTTRKKDYPSWAKSKFEFHELDLMETVSINRCLNSLYPEIVFHLGALQQTDCENNPALARKINVEGTRHLVDDCQRHNVRKYVYLSTIQVYGDFKGIITEETAPQPRSVYAKTKFEGEQIVRESDMQTVIIRLSNAYGYPMDDGVGDNVWTLAFNAFAKSILQNKKITVRSNQYRDFISLEDVTRAIEHIAMTKDVNGIINLGGDECLSIQEAAKRVAKVYEDLHPREPIPISLSPQSGIFKPFQYRIEKLEQTGFQLHGYRVEEILKTFELLEKRPNV